MGRRNFLIVGPKSSSALIRPLRGLKSDTLCKSRQAKDRCSYSPSLLRNDSIETWTKTGRGSYEDI